MKWIKIDKKNLPDGEVLAGNFKSRSYGFKEKLLGYLALDEKEVICESKSEILEGCTHYIDIHNYDPAQ